jgi:hypothetical protein
MRDFQCKSLVEQAERHPKAEASEEAGSLLTTSCSSLVVAVMQPFRSKPLRCHEIAPARDRLDRGALGPVVRAMACRPSPWWRQGVR